MDGQDQQQQPPPPPPPPPKDSRSAEILRKLGVEEKMREGALLMRAKLKDRNALAQCEASLAESAKRIAYLRQQLERLSIGSGSANQSDSTTSSPSQNHAAANNVALAVPVASATHLGSSPSSDSLALTASSSATSLSGVSPSTSVGQLSSASLPTVHVQTSASSAANSTKDPSSSSSGAGGFFSYLKKSMRSKSSSSVNALDPSTSSATGADGAATVGGPASDPRVALAHQLPDVELGKLFLSGPPPMGSLPPLPDPEPSATDPGKEQQPTASNLAASRTGAMLSTQVISSKMRDLTYKLDLATKAVASTSRAGPTDASSMSTASSSSPPSSSGTTSPTQGMSKHASSVSLRHAPHADNTATVAQHNEALVRADALKRALNKFSGLYVPEGPADAADAQALLPTQQVALPTPPPMVTTLPRRQQLGDLTVHVVAARVPPSVKNALSRSRADHYVALVQVDGVVKARSRAFKAPKDKTGCETEIPFNEQVVVTGLDKSAEVEVVLVEADKQGSVKMVDGLVWFRVADVADAVLGEGVRGVQGWFDMDPVGTVLVRATVTPVAARARKVSRLGRQGAVRKKKKVEATRNGHQFVLAQYATIVKCALCSEFIGVSACYACESCAFSCHKKCAPKVLTRCFGSADDEDRAVTDEDGESLPHNIPHRFTPTTNLKAHWCCHCGHLVPLGRGNVKCSECDLMAHKGCALLVPNFCGLSMKRANKMLHEIKLAKDMRAANAIRVAQRQAAILPPQPVAVPELPKPVPPPQKQQLPSEQPAIVARQGEPPAAAPVPSSLSGVAKAVIDRTLAGAVPAPAASVPTTPYPSPPKLVSLDDFSFLAVLGKGNFGKVMLAEERTSRKLYAIKVLKKDFVLENDEVESTRSEKRIFQAANSSRHPFLVNLYATLQTESRLYFVMEYVAGGDLMWHIQREQFNERRARFYACEVLLALHFFHLNNIVYRDLKLDNIMLGMDGHIKLADYGLCKENMPLGATTNTFCGTPEFMAPEILCEQHYGRAVDWWAFGVLVYEMMCGQSPFRGDDEEEIFEAILHDEVLYPITMSRDAVHLCQGLLTKDPRKRLGAGPHDAEEIKRHPFFKGVDWDALVAKRIAPPFVPRITNAVDVSNFDEEFTREPPVLTPIHTTLDEADQMEFTGFSYVAEWVNEAVSVGGGGASMASRYGGR